MHGNQNLKQFQIALLMDNISEAKEISDTLREIGIYAHFYDNLDEFWVAANTETPDLTIVDVKRMSSGTLLFKNHPKVKAGALCYAFFYKDETKVLLNSTYGLNHYGYIRKEVNLTGQIQTILRRRNEELHLIEQNIQLANRVDRLQKRANRVVNDAQISVNFENQYQRLMNIVDRVGTTNSVDEFIKNVANVFSEWEVCANYGIFQLALNGQKLISPKMIRPKYKQFPQLWLSKPCLNGIEQYAIEMAEEVAFDTLERMIRVVKIKGAFDAPDIILIGKFDEDLLNDFQWGLLEERLSSTYRRIQLANQVAGVQIQNEIDVWEAFSYLDDIHFHQAKSQHKLFIVDFSNLLNVIKEKHANRFYWKSFYADFKQELTGLVSGNFKFANYGVQNLMIFFDKTLLDIDYQKVKTFIASYEYWRYFEDSSLMMTEEMYPELKAVAPSSVNFIRQVYTDIMNAGSQTIKRHKSVWEEKQIQV